MPLEQIIGIPIVLLLAFVAPIPFIKNSFSAGSKDANQEPINENSPEKDSNKAPFSSDLKENSKGRCNRCGIKRENRHGVQRIIISIPQDGCICFCCEATCSGKNDGNSKTDDNLRE